MNVKKELIEKEIEQWRGFYNNYDNLSIQIMTDVLARYNKDDRTKIIKDIITTNNIQINHIIINNTTNNIFRDILNIINIIITNIISVS